MDGGDDDHQKYNINVTTGEEERKTYGSILRRGPLSDTTHHPCSVFTLPIQSHQRVVSAESRSKTCPFRLDRNCWRSGTCTSIIIQQ